MALDRTPVNLDELEPMPKCVRRWAEHLSVPDPILSVDRSEIPPRPRAQDQWIASYISEATGYRVKDILRLYPTLLEAFQKYFEYAGKVTLPGLVKFYHIHIPEHRTGIYRQKVLSARTIVVARIDKDLVLRVNKWRPLEQPHVTRSHYIRALRRRDFMANIDMVRQAVEAEKRRVEAANKKANEKRAKKRAARAAADRKLKERVLATAQAQWDKEKAGLLAKIEELQSKLTSSDSTGSSPKTS